MDFKTTETHESKTCEGVKFTVRRLNVIQRAARDLEIAEHGAREQELLAKYLQIADDSKDPALLARTDFEYGMVHNGHVVPCIIRAGLLDVAGLVVDGHAVTAADELLEAPVPQELLAEIYEHCRSVEGLQAEQEKNSLSPGTSAGPADGETESTTAASANGPGTTDNETAASTSPET